MEFREIELEMFTEEQTWVTNHAEGYTTQKLSYVLLFSMELRDTGLYGFLLPADQIIPTSEETW